MMTTQAAGTGSLGARLPLPGAYAARAEPAGIGARRANRFGRGGGVRGYGAGMLFLLRMLFVMLCVPLFVMVDWAAYHYLGSTPGDVTAAISIPAVIYAVWRLSRFDEDEVDPLAADRRRR
jgi:hypothetical protein